MTKKKPKKIVRYRKPRNLNVGMIVFAIIFVYMFFSVSTYLRKEKVQFYEVTEGSIVSDGTYTGLIIRDEDTQYADRSGNINYYIREGRRAATGASIYSIDESGALSAALADNSQDKINLTDKDLIDIKKQLTSLSMSYRDNRFQDVYDAKYSVDAAVMEYANFNTLDNIKQLTETLGGSFTQVKAPESGVISYAIDSFENFKPDQISAAAFDRTNYSKAITKAGKLIEKGAPVYKIVRDENWSLMFPLSEKDVTDYGSDTSLLVSFPGHDLQLNGKFSMVTGTDGKPYGKLDFSQYMIQFVSDRYVDFEIVSSKVEGLKIPTSSVTTNSFYLVPVDYLAKGGDSTDDGFLKEVSSESGPSSVVFVPADILNSTEDYYYIDLGDGDDGLKVGDYIVKPGSTDRYQIGPTSSLQGVYNINRGYAVFKQIEVLAQNNEYYIVKKGTRYGLSVYDHIVMDASIIKKEGVLIYQ